MNRERSECISITRVLRRFCRRRSLRCAKRKHSLGMLERYMPRVWRQKNRSTIRASRSRVSWDAKRARSFSLPVSPSRVIFRLSDKRDQVPFRADGGQASRYLRTLVRSLGVALLSLGANKLYGPHGIGALYRGKDMHLSPIIVGGKQERGLRAGTENVALAAGFAAAYDVVAGERERESKRVRNLRDELANALLPKIPGLVVNGSTPLDATRDKSPTTGGDLDEALPHMLNVSIPDISSEYITLALDTKGIAVSTKSACREGEESRSHVVA